MPQTFALMVKAVPGARRDEVVGWLGERLKVRVSAPPEGGKANEAICSLLAQELGLRPAAIAVTRGRSAAEKTIQINGATLDDVLAKWPRG